MARKKAPPKKATPFKESWKLEYLRNRLKTDDTADFYALARDQQGVDFIRRIYALAQESVEYARQLEGEAFEAQQRFDELSKQNDDLENDVSDLEDRLQDYDTKVSNAARKVVALVPVVLGREDALAEPLEAFNLRRAVEDLKTVC